MTHVVVAIITKRSNSDEYLLISSRRDFGKYTGYYYPPSGHVEEGEDELSALHREMREELNAGVTAVEKLVDTDGDIQNQKTSWYLCEFDGYEFTVNEDELQDVGFFTSEQMETMNVWPATRKMFAEYIFKE